MKKRRWGFLAGLAVLVVLAAACSDVSNDNSGGSSGATGASGGSQVPDNSGTTINLAISPWTGSDANVAVAQALLQDKLGYTVKTTKIDEYAQFPALANGQLSATLEVWPRSRQGHRKFITQQRRRGRRSAERDQRMAGGSTYMLMMLWARLLGRPQDRRDDVQTAEAAARTDPGRRSQLRHVRPAVADNLRLDLKVVWRFGRPSSRRWTRRTGRAHPRALDFPGRGQYDLTMMKLPDVTPACRCAADDASKYACAYPDDSTRRSAPDVQSVPRRSRSVAMSYTNDDQNAMRGINNEMTPRRHRVVDANPDVWRHYWVDAGLAAQG
jgi:glycine betaine/proline transport system substrate-binding protein